MGRLLVNELDRARSVSISIPGPYLRIIDKAGNRSEVIQHLIEQNLESLGGLSVEEAEEIKRAVMRDRIIRYLKKDIEGITEELLKGNMKKLRAVLDEALDIDEEGVEIDAGDKG